MRGLYAIVDAATLEARGLDPVRFAEAVLRASPAALQLRAKEMSARQALALLRELAPMCRRLRVTLVANDRPDLAIMAGCDAVHVGQHDMPIDQVRRIARGIGVGVSTHTLDQLETALAARPAYVAFGPVFATSTKNNADPVVGLSALRMAHDRSRAAGIPLVAIGGVTRERARDLVGLADAVAVVSALLPPASLVEARPSTSELLREVTSRALAFQTIFSPLHSPDGAAAEAVR